MQVTQETATVSFIKGDFAYLETGSTSVCGSCSAKSSCGSFSFLKRSNSFLRVVNTLNLKSGDSVIVGLATNKLLLGSVLMYLLPLLMFFLFAFVGKVAGGETTSIIAGIVGLLGGLLVLKRVVGRSNVAKQFEPKVIRKVVGINVEE